MEVKIDVVWNSNGHEQSITLSSDDENGEHKFRTIERVDLNQVEYQIYDDSEVGDAVVHDSYTVQLATVRSIRMKLPAISREPVPT